MAAVVAEGEEAAVEVEQRTTQIHQFGLFEQARGPLVTTFEQME